MDLLRSGPGLDARRLDSHRNLPPNDRGGVVRTMLLEHEAIGELMDDLDRSAQADDIAGAAGALWGLRSVVLLHLAEEEEVYMPALAGLSDDEAEDIASRLGLAHDH